MVTWAERRMARRYMRTAGKAPTIKQWDALTDRINKRNAALAKHLYYVTTSVNGEQISGEGIDDPFVNIRIEISWKDLLRSLLFRRGMKVGASVSGTREAMHKVMDAEHLMYTSATLPKVRDVLMKMGNTNTRATDIITQLQNNGILFRERWTDDVTDDERPVAGGHS